MISELKDDEILDFLMTSDFEDDYSPSELKYLLIKWRYFYRLLHGQSDQKIIQFESEIKKLKNNMLEFKIKFLHLMVVCKSLKWGRGRLSMLHR